MMLQEFSCPSCGDETEHEILQETPSKLVVRCLTCGHVHAAAPQKESALIKVRAVVSIDSVSTTATVELFEDEICTVGDILVADAKEDSYAAEVTDIETPGDVRVSSAPVTVISTLWMRAVEEINVRVSVHDGRSTCPVLYKCKGDEDITIGEVYSMGNLRFRVTAMKLRNGAMMRKEGWKAYARKTRRVFSEKV